MGLLCRSRLLGHHSYTPQCQLHKETPLIIYKVQSEAQAVPGLRARALARLRRHGLYIGDVPVFHGRADSVGVARVVYGVAVRCLVPCVGTCSQYMCVCVSGMGLFYICENVKALVTDSFTKWSPNSTLFVRTCMCVFRLAQSCYVRSDVYVSVYMQQVYIALVCMSMHMYTSAGFYILHENTCTHF
jgi:hypothetical protein